MSIKMSRIKQIINEEIQLFLEQNQKQSLEEQGGEDELDKIYDRLGIARREAKAAKRELDAAKRSKANKEPKYWGTWDKKIAELRTDYKVKLGRKQGLEQRIANIRAKQKKDAAPAEVPAGGKTDPHGVTEPPGPGGKSCIPGYKYDAAVGDCVRIKKKKKRGRKGRKVRRSGRSRAALNRTFMRGVMPKGTGFSNFKDFYAALDKAGIKIRKDSHWGRKHYRKWIQLRRAMKGKGGLKGGVEMSAAAAKMARTGKGGPAAGMSANMAQSRDARMASLAISQGRAARMVKNAEKLGLSPAQVAKYKKQLAGIEKQMKGVEAETSVADSKELAQMSKDIRTQANIDFSTDPKRAAAAQARLDKAADLDPLNPNSKVAKAKRAAAAKKKAEEEKAWGGKKLTPKERATLVNLGYDPKTGKLKTGTSE